MIHFNKNLVLGLFVLVLAGGALAYFVVRKTEPARSPQQGISAPDAEYKQELPEAQIIPFAIVAEDLQIPWEVAFLPGGDVLVTQRTGTVLRIRDRKTYQIQGVEHSGERGLMGMALHPNFASNKWIYLYFTTDIGGALRNKLERYRLEDDNLYDQTIIMDNIPGAIYHDGGRIEFGPDGMLYITTGDANQSALAQNINSLAGKILRIRDDGSIPNDNPFGSAVWTYGHRNPQGLVWDKQGRLWATEHGRSGVLSGLDELNLIEKGKNYGWPTIQGDEQGEGMVTSVLNSGPNYTWAPADIEIIGNALFFGGLRGEALYEVSLDGFSIRSHFLHEYGRIRAVRLGPDGYLYISTSNTDGRGDIRSGDDKIIRIHPDVFKQ